MDHVVTSDGGDLLMGAAAIARHLGMSRRQVYHHIAAGRLPSFKLGGTVAARRSSLAAWLAEQEAGAGRSVSAH